VTELAPEIWSLGHGKGGYVHAFLIDGGGELHSSTAGGKEPTDFAAARKPAGPRRTTLDARDRFRTPAKVSPAPGVYYTGWRV
jgi:hypothetical protein